MQSLLAGTMPQYTECYCWPTRGDLAASLGGSHFQSFPLQGMTDKCKSAVRAHLLRTRAQRRDAAAQTHRAADLQVATDRCCACAHVHTLHAALLHYSVLQKPR
jgi:hypothetical protein